MLVSGRAIIFWSLSPVTILRFSWLSLKKHYPLNHERQHIKYLEIQNMIFHRLPWFLGGIIEHSNQPPEEEPPPQRPHLRRSLSSWRPVFFFVFFGVKLRGPPKKSESLPGDSKWPFYPLVGGHLTIWKGHLTIPKRSLWITWWVSSF